MNQYLEKMLQCLKCLTTRIFENKNLKKSKRHCLMVFENRRMFLRFMLKFRRKSSSGIGNAYNSIYAIICYVLLCILKLSVFNNYY